MAVHYRTQGIIIKKGDIREADQLFTIFTKDFGKLEILGKAIRKIKSKLKGGLETFYLSEIEFIQGKTYKTLTDAIVIENFKNIRKDLERLAAAYRISEVLDDLIRGQEPDQEIWELLNEVFNKLNNLSFVISRRASEGGEGGKENGVLFDHWSLLYYYFLWNFLSILGYQPEVYNCAICQRKLTPKKLHFSLKEGGAVCSNCVKQVKTAEKIEPEVIKILRILLKKDWDTLSRLKIENSHRKSLKAISNTALFFILGER